MLGWLKLDTKLDTCCWGTSIYIFQSESNAWYGHKEMSKPGNLTQELMLPKIQQSKDSRMFLRESELKH